MRATVPVVQHGRARRRTPAVRALWGAAEAAVTLGLVLLLLVAHQLWWTNRQARAAAERKVAALEEAWKEWGEEGGPGGGPDAGDGAPPASPVGAGDRADGGRDRSHAGDEGDEGDADDADDAGTGSGSGSDPAPTPRWDQAYAVLRIPRIGIRVPVAEGVSKRAVLNHGYAGHYPRTAQPGRAGNFALAGHRNTHGEPFRHINRLRRGDEIRVETAHAVYTYVVDKALARTSARDGGVIGAVPRSEVRRGYGYREPGYYVTLTTCTPEYTSKYRLVVWGKLRAMRPR
ncbi:class E sortase [Streptomyces sp. NPDC046465]|uniref:class E sortase n=1 Tax=Streptomyces sp. NPDC046465 TaxID=3155810 RepID=UPI0033D7F471